MNNTVVHFVSQTYQALKALKVALMTLIHSIKTGKKRYNAEQHADLFAYCFASSFR